MECCLEGRFFWDKVKMWQDWLKGRLSLGKIYLGQGLEEVYLEGGFTHCNVNLIEGSLGTRLTWG